MGIHVSIAAYTTARQAKTRIGVEGTGRLTVRADKCIAPPNVKPHDEYKVTGSGYYADSNEANSGRLGPRNVDLGTVFGCYRENQDDQKSGGPRSRI